MAKIEAIENRLLNWARWLDSPSGGKLGFASVDYGRVESSRDRYREATIPCDDDEARQTDEAVKALGEPWSRTLVVVYVEGRNAKHNAKLLGLYGENPEATIKARVWVAHRRLSHWFTDRAALARDRRANLERLQQGARP